MDQYDAYCGYSLMTARASLARSRAVVICSGAGSPLGLTNMVRVMPRRRAVSFMLGHELDIGAADGFGQHDRDVVGGLDDHGLQGAFDQDLRADDNAKLARRLLRRKLADRKFLIERELAFLDGLERQIGRHDLGQRRRMPLIVEVLGVEDLAIGGIEQQGRSGNAPGPAASARICKAAAMSLTRM